MAGVLAGKPAPCRALRSPPPGQVAVFGPEKSRPAPTPLRLAEVPLGSSSPRSVVWANQEL